MLMNVKLIWLLAVIMSLLGVRESVGNEIVKEELFANPTLISAKISPDGNRVASIGADKNGISNLFISTKEYPEAREQITFFQTPEIIQFFWSGNSQRVLLLKEEDGTGQMLLYGVDIQTKEYVIYCEKAKVIKISSKENSAVIGINDRNPYYQDLYLLDLDSGKLTLLLQNDTFAKFLVSDSLDLILKVRINDDGSWTIFNKGLSKNKIKCLDSARPSPIEAMRSERGSSSPSGKGDEEDRLGEVAASPNALDYSLAFPQEDQIFMELTSEDAFQTELLSYNEALQGVYLLDNRSTDTNQLMLKTLSGEEINLGWQPDSDVDDLLFIEGTPIAYASYYTQKKWHAIDPSAQEDIDFLEKEIPNFDMINATKNVWILSTSVPHLGGRLWLYERENKKLTPLYSKKENSSFSKMYPMVVEARDGQKLVCYYTLPKEYDKGGYVEKPIPLVVFPHGGPFKVRDRYEFNPYHQWLSSLGYAVLSVNFRLSSGFGKAFVNAGNGEWGGKAHLDVIDAVECAISKGITERGKLAVFGGSYGGYESLSCLTFTPDYFNCCIAVCGPSNLKTVLDNVPKFWEFTDGPLSDRTLFFTKKAFITSMGGDPDKPEGIAYLEKCSPLNYLDNIQVPLLLMHGKNDHVVQEKESEQIYQSMKKNNRQVTYILFPDEGHRFAKFPNRMMELDAIEAFLSQYLGGKYTPISQAIREKSSAIVHN